MGLHVACVTDTLWERVCEEVGRRLYGCSPLHLRWEFIKENKKTRTQELDQESDQENKKVNKFPLLEHGPVTQCFYYFVQYFV